MGRKVGKGGKKAAAGASDTSSLTTADTADDATAPYVPRDPWEAAWHNTMEAAAAARAKGIQDVCKLLRSGCDPDLVESMEDKVVDTARSALTARKSDRRLEAAACDMLALFCVTTGRRCAAAFDGLQDALEERCRDGRARAAAVAAYAAGAFCRGGVDAERLHALRFLAGMWLCQSGDALVAALRGWALVLTSVDVRTMSVPLIDATLEHLARLLEGNAVAVRNAAAVALALLYKVCGLEVLPDDDDELLEGADAAASTASMDGSACAVSSEARDALESGFQGIVARLEALAKSRGDASKLNKRDKKASRSVAADMVAAISGDGERVDKFKFRSGATVVFDSLEARVKRDALCDVLQGSFQAHMAENPFLEEVFGLEGGASGGGGGGGGKQWRQDLESQRTSKAKQRRSQRAEALGAHMMDGW